MNITTLKTVLAAFLVVATSHALAGTTKVIGQYGKYNVYDMKFEDLDGSLPYNVDGETNVDAITLAKRLKPVDQADVNKNGIKCEFLCEDPKERIIGYNPAALASRLKMAGIPAATLLANAQASAKTAPTMVQVKQQPVQRMNPYTCKAVKDPTTNIYHCPATVAYAPPPKTNPSTESAIPLDVLRWAIEKNTVNGYDVTTWKEDNAYTLKDQQGETVHWVEYTTTLYLREPLMYLVNLESADGVPSPVGRETRKVGMILRGKKWIFAYK